jgi:hypothetical protein
MHRILEPQVIFRVRDDGLTHRDRTEYVGWTHRLEIVRALSKELPDRYHAQLGREALLNGSRLFRLGARRQARQAFELARELGCTAHEAGPWWYERLAGTAGPESAEWALYVRHALVQGLRRLKLLSASQGPAGQNHAA